LQSSTGAHQIGVPPNRVLDGWFLGVIAEHKQLCA
jgi:hypothetical protein